MTLNLGLKPLEEIMTDNPGLVIKRVPLELTHPPEGHAFAVKHDKKMDALIASIKRIGIKEPPIMRECEDGTFEVTAGNRRCYAAKAAGLTEVDAIIENPALDQHISDEAEVDTNFVRRDKYDHSELARALAKKAAAITHRGAKREEDNIYLTLASEYDFSPAKVKRYIALSKCIDEVLALVDAKQIPVTVALDLTKLSREQQLAIATAVDGLGRKLTAKCAQAVLDEINASGSLTATQVEDVLIDMENDADEKPKGKTIQIGMDELKRFFPASADPKAIKTQILQLLAATAQRRENTR